MWKPVSPGQSVFLANLTSYAKLFCFAQVYLKVGKPLVYAALNGYKGTLLTYGQTGTGNECNMTWLSARQNSAHVVAGFTLPLSFPAELGIECTPFADHLTKRNESFEQKNLTTLGRILYFQASSFFAAQWAQKKHLLGRKKAWKSLRMTLCYKHFKKCFRKTKSIQNVKKEELLGWLLR